MAEDMQVTGEDSRAKPSQIRDYFGTPEGQYPKVSLTEIKQLKENPQDYDQIANGIGNGTFTY
jgi:hypothetical protein